MEWCKLYASLQHDPDLRRAGERATLLFVFGLCHCAEEETDGYIADDVLPYFKLSGVEARAASLVRVGCWQRVSDGYTVPRWREKQKELYAIMDKRQKDRERVANKRKVSRDSRTTPAEVSRDSRENVAVENREEKTTTGATLPPAVAGAEIIPLPPPITAQTLVAEWVDHCQSRPPKQVVGQIAKLLGSMLGEGLPPLAVRAGLAAWHQAAVADANGRHPSTLPSFVHAAANAGSRGSTGDQRVRQAVEAGRRIQAMVDSGGAP
jgi:hypothetical protein